MTQDRVTTRFSDSVAGGATETLAKDFNFSATVERVRVRIYTGAELDLEIRPYVKRDETEQVDLIDTKGRNTIVGDDDVFVFDTSVPIESDDALVVEATNLDPDFSLDYACDITWDTIGGTESVRSTLWSELVGRVV